MNDEMIVDAPVKRLPLPPPNRALALCVERERKPIYHSQTPVRRVKMAPSAQLVVPKDGYVYRPLIRSTLVRDYYKCQRYFLYEYRLGLYRPAHYVPSLSMGALFHKAADVLVKERFQLAAADEALRVAVNKTIQEAEARVDKLGFLPDGRSLESLTERLNEDRQKALAMAKVYLEHYSAWPSNMQLIGSELQITAEVVGLRSWVTGRIDLLLSESDDPTVLWIKDYKTTASNPALVCDALSFDIQPHLYRLLVMARYPDASVVGCDHTIIEKPTIKFCNKDANFEAYIQRMLQWYGDREKRARVEEQSMNPAPSYPVRSSKTFYLSHSLPPDRWAVLKTVDRACYGRISLEQFPRSPSNYTCLGPGGSQPCKYLPLCRQQDGALLDLWVGPPGSGRAYEQRNPNELDTADEHTTESST